MIPSCDDTSQEDATILCVTNGEPILLPTDLPIEEEPPSPPKHSFSFHQLKNRLNQVKHVMKKVQLPRVVMKREKLALGDEHFTNANEVH